MVDRTTPIAQQLLRLGDIDSAITDYVGAVETKMAGHPRSKQTRIGPSEIGVACDRRIGYKLAGVPGRTQAPSWRAQIGTAVHAWMEAVFDSYNLAHAAELGGQERYLVENRVDLGVVPWLGYRVTGSCDLYDRVTGTVLDHKIVGPAQLKNYKANGPSPQYRVQAHLYGYGWGLAGHPVETVAIAFWPRNGDLKDVHVWHEPYSADTAKNALSRLSGIAQAVNLLGDGVFEHLATADSYCGYCPFYKPNATSLAEGCPGDPNSVANQPSQPPLKLAA